MDDIKQFGFHGVSMLQQHDRFSDHPHSFQITLGRTGRHLDSSRKAETQYIGWDVTVAKQKGDPLQGNMSYNSHMFIGRPDQLDGKEDSRVTVDQ